MNAGVVVTVLLGSQDRPHLSAVQSAVFKQKDSPDHGVREFASIKCVVQALQCLTQFSVTNRIPCAANPSRSFAAMSVGTFPTRPECRNAVSRVSTPVSFTSSTYGIETPTSYTCGRCLRLLTRRGPRVGAEGICPDAPNRRWLLPAICGLGRIHPERPASPPILIDDSVESVLRTAAEYRGRTGHNRAGVNEHDNETFLFRPSDANTREL